MPIPRIPVICFLGFQALAGAAHARETVVERTERLETARVERLIADGNCPAAVNAIKAGVAAKKPYIMQLAGNMFEEGLCVKQDWDKAVGLYMRAEEAGHRYAIGRLIAGYARPGRDNGMALYWAARSPRRGQYPGHCIPRADPVSDPDGFNAELEKMPPVAFQSCVYFAGIVNEIYSQVRYPRMALLSGVSGQYTMHFVPAAGTVTWTIDEFEMNENLGASRNLADEGLNNPRTIKNSLLTYLQGKGNFALGRYTRPPASMFPPDYEFGTHFVFSIER
jgi:hypothetical protein